MPPAPAGTAGYAQVADALLATVLPFEVVHAPVLHLIPPPPARILDAGSGPGHSAAHLARLGHQLTAVEPTPALLEGARRLYADQPGITWLDDSLPDLARLPADTAPFDFILLDGVWMHLDAAERPAAMARLAGLLAPGGVLAIFLRHGWVPPGRLMHQVPPDETVAQAAQHGLACAVNVATESLQGVNRDHGVTWTKLAFVRAR